MAITVTILTNTASADHGDMTPAEHDDWIIQNNTLVNTSTACNIFVHVHGMDGDTDEAVFSNMSFLRYPTVYDSTPSGLKVGRRFRVINNSVTDCNGTLFNLNKRNVTAVNTRIDQNQVTINDEYSNIVVGWNKTFEIVSKDLFPGSAQYVQQ